MSPARREVLAGGLAASLAGPAAAAGPLSFPKGFLWGAATAAYQVEGGAAEGGRGPSIWDTFSHTPGKTQNGDTGDVACDSYHRWRDDIALLRELGVKSYRFSIAWPRVQPKGRGPANPVGLDYYKRLTDGLLTAGIRPFPTLYHWDLPQPLEDAGGWPVRDTALRMVDYSRLVADALGDRITAWSVFNEPKTFAQAGYWDGGHAPGRREPLAMLKATHVINLAQGLVSRELKRARPGVKVGSCYDVSPCWPATDSPEDKAAAARWDAFINLWFVQTTLTGRYPALLPPDREAELLGLQPGDEAILKAGLDFVGLNYYSGWRVAHAAEGNGVPGLNTRGEWAKSPRATGQADNGWDIDPPGLYDILQRMRRVTGAIPLEITENGTADNTPVSTGGRFHDTRRIAFLRQHLSELHRAIADGAPVRAYHLWSLMDNFEWGEGYSQRFGAVHVDFAHGQKRTLRDSGTWYGRVARANTLV